ATGKPLIFVGDFYGVGATHYADGVSVNIRIQPVSGGGVMPLSALPTDVLTFDSRAIRPYPPGDLRIAGQSYPAKVSAIEVPVTWAHRDRLQQTGGELIDHTEGDVGPEDGTTYTVRVRDEM